MNYSYFEACTLKLLDIKIFSDQLVNKQFVYYLKDDDYLFTTNI